MKQILKLGINRYVHLDSYGERKPTALENFCVFLGVTLIGTIVAGAMLGFDITTPNNGSTGGVPVQHSTQVESKR
jgi:hypothetical protein